MMGPKHYREAEKLVGYAMNGVPKSDAEKMQILAAAQVHATLALVTTGVWPSLERYCDMAGEADEWLGATADDEVRRS